MIVLLKLSLAFHLPYSVNVRPSSKNPELPFKGESVAELIGQSVSLRFKSRSDHLAGVVSQ